MQASRMKAGGRGRRCSHRERFQREVGNQAIRRVTGKTIKLGESPTFWRSRKPKGAKACCNFKEGR